MSTRFVFFVSVLLLAVVILDAYTNVFGLYTVFSLGCIFAFWIIEIIYNDKLNYKCRKAIGLSIPLYVWYKIEDFSFHINTRRVVVSMQTQIANFYLTDQFISFADINSEQGYWMDIRQVVGYKRLSIRNITFTQKDRVCVTCKFQMEENVQVTQYWVWERNNKDCVKSPWLLLSVTTQSV